MRQVTDFNFSCMLHNVEFATFHNSVHKFKNRLSSGFKCKYNALSCVDIKAL